MKKTLLHGICTVFICTSVLAACSDENSSGESRESLNRARLEAIIQKYDIGFVLNDSILSTNVSEANIMEFENMLKCLASMKGTYNLHADSINDETFTYSQLKKHPRNRRLINSDEIVTFDSHTFESQTVFDLYHSMVEYTCSCIIRWKKVNGITQWVKLSPHIDFVHIDDSFNGYNIELWGNNYDTFISSDSTYRFHGVVHGDVIVDYVTYGYVVFGYDGFLFKHDGQISWTYINSYF